jgi:phosphate-selective porin OprO/OprP
MRSRILSLAIVLALASPPLAAAGAPARGDETSEAATLAALHAQVQQLAAANAQLQEQLAVVSQQLAIVARQQEIGAEKAAEALPNTPVVAFGDRGLSVKNRVGDYELKLRGVLHFDHRHFIDDDSPALPDGFLFRRVRPSLEGNLGPLLSYRITPELGGDSATLLDAWVDVKYSPAALLRVGKQKSPIGLERLQSASALGFVERGFPTELAPNRDIGVQVLGEVLKGEASYGIGVFNGTPDGRDSPAANADDHIELAGRVFFEPWRNDANALSGLGFGLAASHGEKTGGGNTLLPRYRTPGQNVFFNYRSAVVADGTHERLSPQFYFYRRQLGLLGEWIRSSQEVLLPGATPRRAALDNTGWQLSATWFLTGEDATYRGLARPNTPLAFGRDGWGAFELVGRVGELAVDDGAFPFFADSATSAQRARSYTLGLNWYLNAHAKLLFDYSQTTFDGGAPSGGDRDDEKVFISRLQLAF